LQDKKKARQRNEVYLLTYPRSGDVSRERFVEQVTAAFNKFARSTNVIQKWICVQECHDDQEGDADSDDDETDAVESDDGEAITHKNSDDESSESDAEGEPSAKRPKKDPRHLHMAIKLTKRMTFTKIAKYLQEKAPLKARINFSVRHTQFATAAAYLIVPSDHKPADSLDSEWIADEESTKRINKCCDHLLIDPKDITEVHPAHNAKHHPSVDCPCRWKSCEGGRAKKPSLSLEEFQEWVEEIKVFEYATILQIANSPGHEMCLEWIRKNYDKVPKVLQACQDMVRALDSRTSAERYNAKLQAADRYPKYQSTLKNLYQILSKHKVDIPKFREVVKASVFDCKYDQYGHLVFVGPPNCGKSSIIDAIAGPECPPFEGGILEGTEPGGSKSVHALDPLLNAEVGIFPEFNSFIERGVIDYGKLNSMLEGTAHTGGGSRHGINRIPPIPYLFACKSQVETGDNESWCARTHTFTLLGGSFENKKSKQLKPSKYDMAFLLLHDDLDNSWRTMDTNLDNSVDGWFSI
jgi:hypothetical protein